MMGIGQKDPQGAATTIFVGCRPEILKSSREREREIKRVLTTCVCGRESQRESGEHGNSMQKIPLIRDRVPVGVMFARAHFANILAVDYDTQTYRAKCKFKF